MPWQEMSKMIKEIEKELDTIAHTINELANRHIEKLAAISDIKTRLDDLETAVGNLQVERNGIGAITGFTPEQEYTVQALKFEIRTGHLPECGCIECESLLWGS